jgi:hypothetical protein
MLPTILIVVALVVVGILVFVAMQPADFRLSRSATMAAAPGEVFAEVNDFHRWDNWSPWAKIDPAMKVTYDGPSAGEGAAYSWDGNNKAGAGKMTIIKSQPGERVVLRLEFLKPFKATNQAEFSFEAKDKGTLVTWTMTGTKNFMMKAVHLMMNMDKMIGPDFEKGLAQMKVVVEKGKP